MSVSLRPSEKRRGILGAMSPTDREWMVREVDADAVEAVSASFDLSPVVAKLVVARGHSVESAHSFLKPRLADLAPPGDMAGLSAALDRLELVLDQGDRVGIFGDYDVDGVTSAALLGDYLRGCGADVTIRVARRDEGYGFSPVQAQEMVDRGCHVLLVTDCGTSDLDAVTHATQQNVDVIAVDHHRVVTAQGWPGLALVNPHRPDCGFEYKGLCSVGLAFYIMAGLRSRRTAKGLESPDPRRSLDLVAVGTLADVAPLDGVNRILVARGLDQLRRTHRPGLQELLKLADLSGRAPTSEDIGWRIGPRLNAPGRLGDAGVALECLWLEDAQRAKERARECDVLNERRKEVQRDILVQAREQAIQGGSQDFVLVAGDGWHPGVIGIVASKLVDEFGCPAAVVALEGDRGRASARSVQGIDLFALLQQCGELMERFGGHAAAAGFTVARDNVDSLRDALRRSASLMSTASMKRPLAIDAVADLSQLNFELCEQLSQIGPYGPENPSPVFVSGSVRVETAREVGSGHISLALRQGGAVRYGIGFGMLASMPEVGSKVDVAYTPQLDYYNGTRLRLRLIDVAPAGQGLVDLDMGGYP